MGMSLMRYIPMHMNANRGRNSGHGIVSPLRRSPARGIPDRNPDDSPGDHRYAVRAQALRGEHARRRASRRKERAGAFELAHQYANEAAGHSEARRAEGSEMKLTATAPTNVERPHRT